MLKPAYRLPLFFGPNRVGFLLFCFVCIFSSEVSSQTMFMQEDGNPSGFWRVDYCPCINCIDEEWGEISINNDIGFTIVPEGYLYGINDNAELYRVDTNTGAWTFVMDFPFPTRSLCAISNDILYTRKGGGAKDSLVEVHLNTLTYTVISALEYRVAGDFTLYNGEIYYTVRTGIDPSGIAKVNLANPSDGIYIMDIPTPLRSIRALTATRECNTLLGVDNYNQSYVSIDLNGGGITNIAQTPYINMMAITSFIEFETIICQTSLDLDCDDSSGEPDGDFHSPNYNCLSDGVNIMDVDPLFYSDTLIDEMSLTLTGNIPDGNNEFLELEDPTPYIDVDGSGTQMITLTSDGTATADDFKNAVLDILYRNVAFELTPGIRTIEIFYSTYSGATTDIATTFIEVVEHPKYDLDLGPDTTICDEEELTFDTDLEDINYEWSTGEHTQSIQVSDPGIYSVTVTGDEFCPNQDSVEVTVLPLIHVNLEEDATACDNDELTLTIETDAPFPITVQILVSPDDTLIFTDVIGSYEIPIQPLVDTFYSIGTVFSPEPACIEIGMDLQLFEISPTYLDTVSLSICEGDSILIESQWISDEGIYTDYLQSIDGCDSVVTIQLSFSSAITVYEFSNSCLPADTGTYIQFFLNPNGCDTIIESTVQLVSLDTTHIYSATCSSDNAGLFTDILSSIQGCDSVIVTSVLYIPPQDTTHVIHILCDSSSQGIFLYRFTAADGCDSLVKTFVIAGAPDTTLLYSTSCDSSSLGVFVEHFTNKELCDSTVITAVTYSSSDSTFHQSTTCVPGEVGIFISSYVNRFGCDSIVTQTVSLIPKVLTSIHSFSCDISMTGVFADTLTGYLGCDSIVVETVDLLPSDQTYINSTTCLSAEAGTFITAHFNQYGCDSIVTVTVTVVPADTTVITFKTCDPAQIGNTENTFVNKDGCDSLVIEQTTLYPLPELQIEVSSDFNGYAISCFGEIDGSANAEVTGVPPWIYLWSTGSDDQAVIGLSAGSYAVTVTDGNGCSTSGEVTLLEPEEFSISFIVSHPDCFDHQKGSIIVEQIGGIEPIRYSVDDLNYQASPFFDQLSGGTYTVTAIDANGCEVKEIIWINVPLMVHVELPDDQIAFPGDTIFINAIVNVPFDSLANVVWSGISNPACPTCLSQPVAPLITTTYSVTVTDMDGCIDKDEMTLFLERHDDVFVPNIFSPNGDNVNDRLVINVGRDVEEIESLIILDRWGNIVFQENGFQANDPSKSWDGTMKGNDLNPGVFAYRIIVGFKSGQQNVLYGDVTIIR